MYHPPSKRSQLIRRVIIYSGMTVAVVALVITLVFVVLGYQFNKSDGKIEQGGLVQFDSRPSGADVTIDGAGFGSRTASKATLTSGQHFITMSRSGYQTWQKAVTVAPGSVLWLNYTRLVPNDLQPINVARFPTITSTAASPDEKWLAIKEDAATPNIRLADLSGDTVKVGELVVPPDSYTHPAEGKSQSFSLETWDPGSRRLLVKHTYDDDKFEWLVIDPRDMTATVNITKLFNIEASKLLFSADSSNLLYAKVGADIRQIDLGAATIAPPLLTNVADFSVDDRSTLTYTTLLDKDNKTRSIGYYQEGDKPRLIRTYSDDGTLPLHLAMGKYFGDTYWTIAYGESVEVIKGDPTQATTSSKTQQMIKKFAFPGGVNQLSIMTDGRFVTAQNGGTYMIYDIELKKLTSTTLKGTEVVTKKLSWLDGYTIWSDRDNMLRLYEFDGANQHNIMPVTPGFSATLSPNAKYLYGINRTSDGVWHLERVRMIL